MSTVYLAEDVRLGKRWAVKILPKNRNGMNEEIVRRSCLAEVRALKKLDHPALPRIVDFLEDDECMFLVMDYIPGKSLEDLLHENGPFSEQQVTRWALELCDVLDYMHRQTPPVIYRDLKPGNIILTESGRIKLIDFGISGEYRSGSRDTVVMGTGGFAPPEQYRGMTDPRSDIYALGMTLRYLMTGETTSRMSAMSGRMRHIIARCTRTNPAGRYQNCAELRAHLQGKRIFLSLWNLRDRMPLRSGKIWLFPVMVLLASVAVGIVLQKGEQVLREKKYQSLLDGQALTSEGRRDDALSAIAMEKGNPEAYEALLRESCADGIFSEEESSVYDGVIRENQDYFDASDPACQKLMFDTGMEYFFYYSDGEEVSFRTKLWKASDYFRAALGEESGQNNAADGTFPDENPYRVCETYLTLGEYYQTFADGITEPEPEWYCTFADALCQCEESVDNYEEESAVPEGMVSYAKMQIYEEIVNLVGDNRAEFCDAGVTEKQLDSLLEDVSGSIGEIEFQTVKNKKLQSEVLEQCGECQEELAVLYENRKEQREKGT